MVFGWFKSKEPAPDPALSAALERWRGAHLLHQRLEALEALAAFPAPEARAELERTLQSLANHVEQERAARLLGKRKDAASVPVLARVLDSLFWRASERGRAGGNAGFGLSMDDGRREAERQMSGVRRACAEALGAIGGDEAKSALQRAAEDPDRGVAEMAKRALDSK